MTPKEILIKAKSLLENKGWCQGAFAKNQEGLHVASRDLTAVSYCAAGALNAWGGSNEDNLIRGQAHDILQNRVGPITIWNDHPDRTKEEVLQAFDKAIKLAAQSE